MNTCCRLWCVICLAWLVVGGLAAARGAEKPKSDEPYGGPPAPPAQAGTADTAAEPYLAQLDLTKAAAFLDQRAHGKEKNCFACHATFSYLPARGLLDPQARGVLETRRALENFVGGYVDKPVPEKLGAVPRAQRILAAVNLAEHDARSTGRLSPLAQKALDQVWHYQLPGGGWDWVKHAEPPAEVDDFFGVAMVALGVGRAPGDYAATPQSQAGLAKMRTWFREHPPVNGHQRGLLLLAAEAIGGVLDEGQRKEIVENLFARQLPDGGWSTAGLADWRRPDKRPLDPKLSDGYGTGFMTFALRQGGQVSAADPRLSRAVDWLKTHQRASGGWYTFSPYKEDRLASYAGTSYAVRALAACGAIPTPRPAATAAQASSSAP